MNHPDEAVNHLTMACATFLSPPALDQSFYNSQKHIDSYSIKHAEKIAPTAIELCEELIVKKGLGDIAGLTVAHKHFDLAPSECVVMRKKLDVREPLYNVVMNFTENNDRLLPVMAVPQILGGKARLMPVLFVFDHEFPEVREMLTRMEAHADELIHQLATASEDLPFSLGICLNVHPSDVEGMTLIEFTEEQHRRQKFRFEELNVNEDKTVPALYLDSQAIPIPRMLPVIWKQEGDKMRPKSCVTCGCCCMDGSD